METNPSSGAPPINNPLVGSPVNPAVPTAQPPAAQAEQVNPQASVPQPNTQSMMSNTPSPQPQSPVSAVTSEKKGSSKFKLFIIISIILIVAIWGAVAFLFFQNQSL